MATSLVLIGVHSASADLSEGRLESSSGTGSESCRKVRQEPAKSFAPVRSLQSAAVSVGLGPSSHVIKLVVCSCLVGTHSHQTSRCPSVSGNPF